MGQINKICIVEAQEKFESLMALAFNEGQSLLIVTGTLLRLERLPDALIPGKVWTAEDFADWN